MNLKRTPGRRTHGRIVLKGISNIYDWRGLDLSNPGHRQVVEFCEDGNEHSSYTKFMEIP